MTGMAFQHTTLGRAFFGHVVMRARERTFGVLTKINLMDKGTGAVYVAKEGDEKWKPVTDKSTLIRVHVVQKFKSN
ncbi:hypothetical protein Hanom_Chr13g01212231 [Helianthus anomalus]